MPYTRGLMVLVFTCSLSSIFRNSQMCSLKKPHSSTTFSGNGVLCSISGKRCNSIAYTQELCPFKINPSGAERRLICLWGRVSSLNKCNPILLVLKLAYSPTTMLIPWLLMPWLLARPGHQQPWYWLYRINGSLASTGNDFNYLHRLSQCSEMIKI